MIGNASGTSLPEGVPISLVSVAPLGGPNVRVVRAAPPEPVLPGQEVVLGVQFEAIGLAGRSSTIDLEQDGVRLARVEHPWTDDAERFTATLRYAPPSSGIQRVTVVARPIAGEITGGDNAADLAIVATARTLRVAAFEPRPSWAAAFVRRALEADPVFDVSSLTRPSRGVEVRAATFPHGLTRPALAPFDAVLAGAPEELSAAEVDALDAFAQERGGAVILLPDRRPSGPYVRLFPSARFEEALLEKPIVVQAQGRAAFSASEFALPHDLEAGGVAIASAAWRGGERAVVASWPRGAGRVIVSGALDAWRYRAGNEDGFATILDRHHRRRGGRRSAAAGGVGPAGARRAGSDRHDSCHGSYRHEPPPRSLQSTHRSWRPTDRSGSCGSGRWRSLACSKGRSARLRRADTRRGPRLPANRRPARRCSSPRACAGRPNTIGRRWISSQPPPAAS